MAENNQIGAQMSERCFSRNPGRSTSKAICVRIERKSGAKIPWIGSPALPAETIARHSISEKVLRKQLQAVALSETNNENNNKKNNISAWPCSFLLFLPYSLVLASFDLLLHWKSGICFALHVHTKHHFSNTYIIVIMPSIRVGPSARFMPLRCDFTVYHSFSFVLSFLLGSSPAVRATAAILSPASAFATPPRGRHWHENWPKRTKTNKSNSETGGKETRNEVLETMMSSNWNPFSNLHFVWESRRRAVCLFSSLD